ncbi:MAG: hypothetical protein R3B48_24975 [Kofleriaceae bacterium]
MRYRYAWLALVWLVATGACGLVESDGPRVDLRALDKQFAIDATAWNVDAAAAAKLLDQACTPGPIPDPCASAVTAFNACKAAICTASCGLESGRCELVLKIELWRSINLLADVPELTTLSDDAMLSVDLEDVTYEITANQLSVATPALSLYAAPSTVMGPGSDGVVKIGTIPSVPPESEFSERSLRFTPDGKELLRRRLSDAQVPFNLIVAANLVVDFLGSVPSGKLTTNVSMHGRASP